MTPTKAYPKMDLIGQVFGEWTVLNFYGNYYGKAPTWACRCACGAIYHVMQCRLLSGQSRSCDDLDIRKCWIADGVGYIPLTKGKVALVSPHRIVELQRWQWSAFLLDGGYYAYRHGKRNELESDVSMARQILGLGPTGEDEREAEHANGNSLDNRDENLRPASRRENETNKPVRRDNKLGVKGTRRRLSKRTGKYRFSVRITHMGREMHLGSFDSAEEAEKVYEEVARKLFGEFTRFKK
jgi:hypothetical protein